MSNIPIIDVDDEDSDDTQDPDVAEQQAQLVVNIIDPKTAPLPVVPAPQGY